MTPDKKVRDALELTARYRIGGIPIVTKGGYLVGLITNRDLKYEEDADLPVTELMTPSEQLVTASPGIELGESKADSAPNSEGKAPNR